MAVRFSALNTGLPLPPGRFLVHIYIRGWVDPRVIVRLEGLGQLKKSNDHFGNRTRDLPACSIVPQQTTPPPLELWQKRIHFVLVFQCLPTKQLADLLSRIALPWTRFMKPICYIPQIFSFSVYGYYSFRSIFWLLHDRNWRSISAEKNERKWLSEKDAWEHKRTRNIFSISCLHCARRFSASEGPKANEECSRLLQYRADQITIHTIRTRKYVARKMSKFG
jgi:hypothetical protein